MESDILKKKNKWINRIIYIFFVIWGVFFIFTFFKKMPNGLSIEGKKRADTQLSLLYDITYQKMEKEKRNSKYLIEFLK